MNGCLSNEKKPSHTDELLFEIIFANGFNSEKIIFSINDIEIVESTLFSDESDGLTGIGYRISRIEGEKAIVTNIFDEGEHLTLKIDQGIVLSVLLNNERFDYLLDKDLGKYVIIESANRQILYEQRIKKPLFD
jgi:hypothetical protein